MLDSESTNGLENFSNIYTLIQFPQVVNNSVKYRRVSPWKTNSHKKFFPSGDKWAWKKFFLIKKGILNHEIIVLQRKKKNTFSYGGLGTNDGKEQQITAGQVGSCLPPEPISSLEEEPALGLLAGRLCEGQRGRAFDMAGSAEAYGSVRGLLRWPHLSPPHSSEDSVGNRQEVRVTFALSPHGPDTDTWWRQVWAHLQLGEALEPD